MTRILVLLPLLAILALGAVFYLQMAGGRDPARIPSALIGRPAPALTLPGLGPAQGIGPGDLSDGRVKLVNFWASWCAPCRIEHPLFEGLAREVDLYGINYKDRTAAALGYLDELGNPYARIGVDADGRAAIEWGVYGVPETFVVDGQGRIVWKHVGEVTPAALRNDILPAIARARSGG